MESVQCTCIRFISQSNFCIHLNQSMPENPLECCREKFPLHLLIEATCSWNNLGRWSQGFSSVDFVCTTIGYDNQPLLPPLPKSLICAVLSCCYALQLPSELPQSLPFNICWNIIPTVHLLQRCLEKPPVLYRTSFWWLWYSPRGFWSHSPDNTCPLYVLKTTHSPGSNV